MLLHMKKRMKLRAVAVLAVLAILTICSLAARAEEPGGTPTGLSGTTLGGYVDSSGSWNVRAARSYLLRAWRFSFSPRLHFWTQL